MARSFVLLELGRPPNSAGAVLDWIMWCLYCGAWRVCLPNICLGSDCGTCHAGCCGASERVRQTPSFAAVLSCSPLKEVPAEDGRGTAEGLQLTLTHVVLCH
jgi:hypothetical protein